MNEQIDEEKLGALVGNILNDLGGAFSVPTVRLGYRLGIFKSLFDDGPATSSELAARTGLSERYVREWAFAQAANGYAHYEPTSKKFSISPEQAMIFCNPQSPVYMEGAFDVAAAMIEGESKVEDVFKTGEGVKWGDTTACLFCAVGSFFRPGYINNIVQSWIPSLNGVEEKLKAGARVADIGCGMGFSTMLMADAYPNSTFVGFDFHEPSTQAASQHASHGGYGDRVRFVTSLAKEIDEGDFDLVTMFDCLHDMGDPRGASKHILNMLKPDGTWMLVEPIAGDKPEDNLNPVGRLYYNGSTMICVPTSLDQEVGEALGAQAGEARLSEIIKNAGFSYVRRATEGPFNMILEARP